MALFSGKVETAYYINPEKTDVEIIYTQGDKHIAYAIQVDFEHPDFKDLLEEVSLDQLDKNTNQRLKQQSETFGNAVNHAVSVYMETEFKERKEQIEKDLDEFKDNWIKERERYYTEIYGESLEEQYKILEKEKKEIAKEWKKLKKKWDEIDNTWVKAKHTEEKMKVAWIETDENWKMAGKAAEVADKSRKDLEKKHKITLKKLEEVTKNFEEFLEEQSEKFKEQLNVDNKLSKDEIEEQYRQMVEHYNELKNNAENLKNNIGFNYPSYVEDLLKRTTSQVMQGREASDVASAIVKDIIQSNTVAALAAHKKIDSNLLEVVMDNESEAAKEELFKLKLAIFEMEKVKKNKNKEQKAKIRKAPTKLKVLVEFDKLNV